MRRVTVLLSTVAVPGTVAPERVIVTAKVCPTVMEAAGRETVGKEPFDVPVTVRRTKTVRPSCRYAASFETLVRFVVLVV